MAEEQKVHMKKVFKKEEMDRSKQDAH